VHCDLSGRRRACSTIAAASAKKILNRYATAEQCLGSRSGPSCGDRLAHDHSADSRRTVRFAVIVRRAI
jgi:hypothetical protein